MPRPRRRHVDPDEVNPEPRSIEGDEDVRPIDQPDEVYEYPP